MNNYLLCGFAKRYVRRRAASKLENIFDVAKHQPDFGNGRYAHNVIEKALVKHAAKLVNFVCLQ